MTDRPLMKPADLPLKDARDNIIPNQNKVEFVIQRWIEENLIDLQAAQDLKYAEKTAATVTSPPIDAPALYSEAYMQQVVDSINEIKQALVNAGVITA